MLLKLVPVLLLFLLNKIVTKANKGGQPAACECDNNELILLSVETLPGCGLIECDITSHDRRYFSGKCSS